MSAGILPQRTLDKVGRMLADVGHRAGLPGNADSADRPDATRVNDCRIAVDTNAGENGS